MQSAADALAFAPPRALIKPTNASRTGSSGVHSGSSSAPRLPPLPSGGTLELLEIGVSIGVGGQLWWRCARLLCSWLLKEVTLINGAVLLELGAGTGACGLYAAAGLAASYVLITDGSCSCCEIMRENIERNQQLLEARVEVAELMFEDEPLPGAFDWIIGSDITYDVTAHHGLCHMVKRLLQRKRGARCILSHEHRRVPPTNQQDLAGSMLRHHSGARKRHIAELDALRPRLASCDARDPHLESLFESAAKHGLTIIPLQTQREQGESFENNASIIELSLLSVPDSTS